MTDSPLDSPTHSLLSSTHPLNGSTTDSSVSSSLPSLPSLPPLDIDPPALKPPYTLEGSIPSAPSQRASLYQIIFGHLKAFGSLLTGFIFKDNNLPLVLNILGHCLAARRLFRANTRYIRQKDTTALVTLLFRNLGGLHLAQAILAALALKERRLSTERMALWVLALVAWSRSLLYIRTTSGLYTLAALQQDAGLNGVLAVITTIALQNTIKRTGRWI